MRILIFGNSGSGKSTLAIRLAKEHQLEHLDLDKLAWLPTNPPSRTPLVDSKKAIEQFISKYTKWVIEGCYSDLLNLLIPHCSEIIFLNPGIERCIENCKKRPWEPHKYPTKAAQDANLPMLIEWVRQYEQREDEFSLKAHEELFNSFVGKKTQKNS